MKFIQCLVRNPKITILLLSGLSSSLQVCWGTLCRAQCEHALLQIVVNNFVRKTFRSPLHLRGDGNLGLAADHGNCSLVCSLG